MFRNKSKGEKRGRGRYNSNARAHSSHRAPKKKPNPWQEKAMGIGTEKGHRRQRIKERWFSSQYLPDGRFQFLSSETSRHEPFRYIPGCSPEQHKAFLETFRNNRLHVHATNGKKNRKRLSKERISREAKFVKAFIDTNDHRMVLGEAHARRYPTKPYEWTISHDHKQTVAINLKLTAAGKLTKDSAARALQPGYKFHVS